VSYIAELIKTNKRAWCFMSIVQARLSAEEDLLVREYARAKNITVSALVRESVLNNIEDDLDLEVYEAAMKQHLAEPQAISFEEMVRLVNA
jgi:hypothetical protein